MYTVFTNTQKKILKRKSEVKRKNEKVGMRHERGVREREDSASVTC